MRLKTAIKAVRLRLCFTSNEFPRWMRGQGAAGGCTLSILAYQTSCLCFRSDNPPSRYRYWAGLNRPLENFIDAYPLQTFSRHENPVFDSKIRGQQRAQDCLILLWKQMGCYNFDENFFFIEEKFVEED